MSGDYAAFETRGNARAVIDHDRNGNRVAASLRQPTIARRKASELSSVERSALMDELVDQLIALKRTVSEQAKEIAGLTARLTAMEAVESVSIINAATGSSRRGRLRWLWSGM